MAKKVFISYSHADDQLLDRLHKHLAQLQREGSISGWYDREIHAGGRIDDEIKRELAEAHIFLACVSPDYIASEYCYEGELTSALQREAEGTLAIVPVIFEPSDWLATPLQKFKALPKDGKAVTEFTNQNVAFLGVVAGLRDLVETMAQQQAPVAQSQRGSVETTATSRYRVKRDHDDLHKRDFVERSFEEIFKFFEASVAEINEVPEIEARLVRTSDDHFACTLINRGMKRAFETLHVRRGGSWGAIEILFGEENSRSTSNGGFSVQADEYQLYLRSSLFNFRADSKNLSPRDAARLLWDELLSKVGVDYD